MMGVSRSCNSVEFHRLKQTPGLEPNKKNIESREFVKVDRRPMKVNEVSNIINGSKRDNIVKASNSSARMMTAYKD